MFCKNCGAELSNKALFCHNCGTKVGETEPAQQTEELLHCPKCGSTQLSANKRGAKIGRGIAVGVLTLGVLSVPAIAAGAAGRNKLQITCMKCGHKWIAGKAK